jgi:hypothetical protein
MGGEVMNRWHQRLAALHGDSSGPAVAPPCAVQNVQNVQNAAPKPAFEHFGQIEQWTEPPVSELPATNRAGVVWSEVEPERAAIVGQEAAIPSVPEIPDEPVLLRDGRRLWRFSQAHDSTSDRAAALIAEAHWCGAVLVADGRELIVVERWLSNLPVEILCELSRCASGVIAALHQQLLVHNRADSRRRGERWPAR